MAIRGAKCVQNGPRAAEHCRKAGRKPRNGRLGGVWDASEPSRLALCDVTTHHPPPAASHPENPGQRPARAHEAGRCGRRGRFEPSQACRERRNGRLSALGSRLSGESRTIDVMIALWKSPPEGLLASFVAREIMMKLKPYRLWAIILFAAFLVPQFVQAKPPPPPLVKWTPRILQQPLQAGQSILVRITAVATLDMYRAVVVPSPSIAPFVKIKPPGIRKSVKKGGKIVRNLRITIPGDFTGVNIEGLVQISPAAIYSKRTISRSPRSTCVVASSAIHTDIPQPLVSNLVLFSNQDDPNLLSFDLLGTGRVDLRGSKDANGIPLQVESLSVTDSAGKSDQFFNSEGRVSQVVAADGSVIDFEWQPDGQVVISAVTGDGAAQANISLRSKLGALTLDGAGGGAIATVCGSN